MNRRNKTAIFDWVILLGALGLVITASEAIGLKHEWQDGAVYTVVLFTAIILSLRPGWGRASFWKSLALIFSGHIVLVMLAVQALPPRRFGFPKLLLIPIGAVEGLFILGFLWRRMQAESKSKAAARNDN